MKTSIWKKCINCKVNCCKEKKIAEKIFLTKKEKNSLIGMNKNFPCKFLDKKGLCLIHKKRPIDCRIWPFDIKNKKGFFYWVYWKTNCPIIKNKAEKEWEKCLIDFENKIIPKLKEELDCYSKFIDKKLRSNFGKPIFLRKINL